MDIIIAGIVAFTSSLALVDDYRKRRQLNNLITTKEFENFVLCEGIVKSETCLPVESEESIKPPEIIGKEITTEIRNYHTIHENQPIYSDGKIVLSVPVAKTYEVWSQNNKTQQFAKNIHMKTGGGITNELHFSNESEISWDKTNNKIVDYIRSTEKILLNDQFRTIFGKKTNNHQSTTIKYIGDEKFVNEKIRSEHFGIDNWKTSFVGICFSLSADYLISTYKKDNRQ